MNKIVYGMLMFMAGMVGTVYAESVGIYQVTDMVGQSEHQILNKDEYTNLVAQIKEEVKVFPAILAVAKKEWDANKDNKIPFPASRIKTRMVKKVGSDYADKEAAMKKLTQLEERTADKIAQESKDKASSRNKNKKPDPEDVAKETMKNTLINSAITDVNRRVTEKVGREVPVFGFMSSTSEKKDVKKEVKKEEPKKDVKPVAPGAKKDAEKKPAL